MLFPTYEEFSVQTRFTPDQVRQILSSQIDNEETSLSWTSYAATKADGSTGEEYRFDTISTNSKRHWAMIDGKVLYENGLTKIEVIVRPSFSSILIAVLVLGFLVFAGILLTLNWFDESMVEVSKDSFVVIVVLCVAYLFVIGASKLEATLTKRWLKSIFQVDEI